VDESDVEALASAATRERLPFGRLLRLYLDPFPLFKNVASQPDALQYNRHRRRVFLPYARRWAVIAIACIAAIARTAALATGHPLLWIPLAALELGFSTGLCMSFLSIAAYVVLGLERL
jgi:hypothetical protein